MRYRLCNIMSTNNGKIRNIDDNLVTWTLSLDSSLAVFRNLAHTSKLVPPRISNLSSYETQMQNVPYYQIVFLVL